MPQDQERGQAAWLEVAPAAGEPLESIVELSSPSGLAEGRLLGQGAPLGGKLVSQAVLGTESEALKGDGMRTEGTGMRTVGGFAWFPNHAMISKTQRSQ